MDRIVVVVGLSIWSCNLVAASTSQSLQQPSCLSNQQINAEFEFLNNAAIPRQDSCCMMDVCGLTCPEETTPPGNGMLNC
jgi:hypothetical protein